MNFILRQLHTFEAVFFFKPVQLSRSMKSVTFTGVFQWFDTAVHNLPAPLVNTLTTTSIASNVLAYGFIFFPAEAKTAKTLRVQVIDKDTGRTFALNFNL